MTSPQLGWLDLGVFTAMLGSSAIIGCYFGFCSGRKNTTKEYLMGGKKMGVLPVSLSLVASHISGITILGVPSEIYRYGSQYSAVLISGFIMSYTVATVYVPVFTKLELTSSYQYLELRFNKRVRKMASVLFVISQLFYIPIVIYVPALAFSQVTGISVHLITPVTCLVCIFYTTLGGLRAVVWTDALQSVLMLGACVAVLALGAHDLGGWSNVWAANERGQRLEFFNLDPDPLARHTFWTVLIGSYFGWLGQCGVMQGMVQRYLSVPDLKSAQMSIFWFSIGLAISKILSIASGWLIYASYEGCDPLITGLVRRPDQLLPLYVMKTAGHIPGFSGLFVAGVFSAALSSMSTGLNALSGVLVEDMLSDMLPRVISKGAWLRISSIFIGVICVSLVFVVEHLGGVLQVALSFGGITNGAMLGLFTLGMFFPRANSKGALIGSIASLSVVSVIVLGAQSAIARGSLKHQTLPVSTLQCAANLTAIMSPHNTVDNSAVLPIFRIFYMYFGVLGAVIVILNSCSRVDNSAVLPIFRISYMYFGVLGAVIVILIGLPASCLFEDSTELHLDLFSPVIHRFIHVKPKSEVPAEDEIPLNKPVKMIPN